MRTVPCVPCKVRSGTGRENHHGRRRHAARGCRRGRPGRPRGCMTRCVDGVGYQPASWCDMLRLRQLSRQNWCIGIGNCRRGRRRRGQGRRPAGGPACGSWYVRTARLAGSVLSLSTSAHCQVSENIHVTWHSDTMGDPSGETTGRRITFPVSRRLSHLSQL